MAKRMRPLTDEQPKCLLKVGEKILLERTIDAMINAGIYEFVVVTGYRDEMIREFIETNYLTTKVVYDQLHLMFVPNADYAHNNNIYSLWLAGKKVRGQEFLLMDSDILCDPETIRLMASQDGSALALNRHELGEEEMKVVVDNDGHITAISKTCPIEKALGESVGIEKVSAEYSEALFRELDQMIEQEGLIDVFYEQAFERLIPQGHTFRVVDTTDLFSYELDTPEDYKRAQELFKEQSDK
jgi:choline kinase